VIDELLLTLPGLAQQVRAENAARLGRIEVSTPDGPDPQDPAEVYPPYAAPPTVHLLGSGAGTRAMTDRDIRYWTNTPWPGVWRFVRWPGWGRSPSPASASWLRS